MNAPQTFAPNAPTSAVGSDNVGTDDVGRQRQAHDGRSSAGRPATSAAVSRTSTVPLPWQVT